MSMFYAYDVKISMMQLSKVLMREAREADRARQEKNDTECISLAGAGNKLRVFVITVFKVIG